MQKTLYLILFLFAFSVNAQKVYFGAGGGFSTRTPVKFQSFSYENDPMQTPGEFGEIRGQQREHGFTLSGAAKFQTFQPVFLTAGISYTQYSGKIDYVRAAGSPWSSLAYFSDKAETQSNFLAISAGIQYEIIQSQVRPYLLLQVNLNRFGETTLELKDGDQLFEELKFASKLRSGWTFGVGINVDLFPKIETSLELTYALQNPVGLNRDENLISALNINLVFYFGLF